MISTLLFQLVYILFCLLLIGLFVSLIIAIIRYLNRH